MYSVYYIRPSQQKSHRRRVATKNLSVTCSISIQSQVTAFIVHQLTASVCVSPPFMARCQIYALTSGFLSRASGRYSGDIFVSYDESSDRPWGLAQVHCPSSFAFFACCVSLFAYFCLFPCFVQHLFFVFSSPFLCFSSPFCFLFLSLFSFLSFLFLLTLMSLLFLFSLANWCIFSFFFFQLSFVVCFLSFVLSFLFALFWFCVLCLIFF